MPKNTQREKDSEKQGSTYKNMKLGSYLADFTHTHAHPSPRGLKACHLILQNFLKRETETDPCGTALENNLDFILKSQVMGSHQTKVSSWGRRQHGKRGRVS